MSQESMRDTEQKMKQAVEVTAKDFTKIRTGRANASILENITVDYYGIDTPLNQTSSISIPEARQLLITPYEKSLLPAIERAINQSDLGVTPNSDGVSIRLNFPPMTEERRKDLVKQVAQRAEEGCVSIRNVRHSAINHFRDLEKSKELTQDELHGLEKQIQELTDKYIAETHAVQKKKEEEVMEI